MVSILASSFPVQPTDFNAENAPAHPMPDISLTFKNISKTYHLGDQTISALKDVSFSVPAGSIQAVIGESGAGKSTLFKAAATLEAPDSGQVLLNNTDLWQLRGPELQRARFNLGVVFQQLHLLPSKTVHENIALPMVFAGKDPAQITRRVDSLLRWVGLFDRAHHYPKNLSGGQRQRVAIARALANSPGLLLCDEPTSALDPSTTNAILNLIRNARDEFGVTVLIITHEMSVVRQICDRITILENGQRVEDGNLAELRQNPHSHTYARLKDSE